MLGVVAVELDEDPVADRAGRVGVVDGDRQPGVQQAGELGGLRRVHDLLPVALRAGGEPVDRHQGQVDGGEAAGDLIELGYAAGIGAEEDGRAVRLQDIGDLRDAVAGRRGGDADRAEAGGLPGVEFGDVAPPFRADLVPGTPVDHDGHVLVGVAGERAQVAVVVMGVADDDAVQARQVGRGGHAPGLALVIQHPLGKPGVGKDLRPVEVEQDASVHDTLKGGGHAGDSR
jgi:hypothetical protein